jgi:hypothetical protein
LKRFLLAFSLLLVTGVAQARVFDINSEKFASYFLLSYGPSAIKQSAFVDEANTAYTYDKTIAANYTGEFGFLYSTPYISFRFGFEVFKPLALKDITADNGGTTAYTFNSEVTGYAPKLGVEVNLHRSATYRSFLQVFAGTASVSYKNDYGSFLEEAKGSSTLYGGSLGVESLLTDTTTYIFEMGYRVMQVSNFKYAKDVASGPDGAAHAAGDPVLDVNGDQRTMNFGGGYISIGFRFYM